MGAQKSERTPERLGYRAGYYARTLVTRVGKLMLRVPQDRQGRFRTEVFERYQRSEKALVSALTEMHIQGVSTRKVKEIPEQLCGHEFSATTISRVTEKLDEELKKFARRRVEEDHPNLALQARYEKIRLDGVIGQPDSAGGHRDRLGGPALRAGGGDGQSGERTRWKEFLLGLKQRGLCGVCVISDDHPGVAQSDPGGAHHKQLLVVDQVRAERDEWVALGKAAGGIDASVLGGQREGLLLGGAGGAAPMTTDAPVPSVSSRTLSRSPSFVLSMRTSAPKPLANSKRRR